MRYQHSICSTFVSIDTGSDCAMLHPRDPDPRDPEVTPELTLHPSLEGALNELDYLANGFFEENPEFELIDTKQFFSPEYKLPVYHESRPTITEVRDITRILVYTKKLTQESIV